MKLKAAPESVPVVPEWRNRQSGMCYRAFGKTGMMVSEITQGTFKWSNKEHLRIFEQAVERGVNYVDASPAYKKGVSEKLLGEYVRTPSKRARLFISNKISFYDEYVWRLYNDIFKGLPQEKKNALKKQAQEMIEERHVLRSGYHFTYFKNQANKIERTYLQYLMEKEYGNLRGWKTKIKQHMHSLVERSLKVSQTAYFDVLHCPHGVAMPEMLESEIIEEVMWELKERGLIRFSAFSAHNDVGAILQKAVELGRFDGTMIAYNVGNHEALDGWVHAANQSGMGIVAMKVARILEVDKAPTAKLEALRESYSQPVSLHAKAYGWALQNKDISCCVSDMISEQMVAENISMVSGTS
jgi:predicted aldo/keto reductase-like oxidoreductase